MSEVEILHNKAMDFAEGAFIAKKRGEDLKAVELFKQALHHECKAANSLSIDINNEPTRSILFRSSASLAQNSNEFDLAERLIANGLAGFPPHEIKEELKNLYEDVNFMRHLSIKGISLTKDQWVMSLSGNSTRFGGTAADQLMMRVDRISSLFYRTVERLLNRPYRFQGGVSKEIKEGYGLYINAFVPGSFSVSFQVGRPNPQLKIFPDFVPLKPSDVIDEIFNCFELFEEDKPEELKEKIEDEMYHDNFVGLAKQMAPDGEDIKLVGFNSIIEGKERPVALRKKRREIQISNEIVESQTAIISDKLILAGTLMHANTPKTGNFGSVKLWNQKDKSTKNISVPIAIMKDVVQPFYEENVVIQGHKKGNKIYLDEIILDSK